MELTNRISRTEIAEQLGVQTQTIAKWERMVVGQFDVTAHSPVLIDSRASMSPTRSAIVQS